MQPNYQQAITPNNFSKELLKKRDDWAKALNIKADEMLIFSAIGTGNTLPLMIKGTDRASANSNFEPMKPVPASRMIPMQESIIDRDAPGGYVQLVHYQGGYMPGKKPSPVIFKGYDETVISVVPEENQALYDFLTLSPRLKDGPYKSTVDAKYVLLRPDLEVENNWDEVQQLARVTLLIGDASIETLTFLAPKLFLPSQVSTEQRMRQNFADYIKIRHANVLTLQGLFDADETLVYQQVEDAISANVVAVNSDKNVWVMTNNQQAITPASPDRNKVDQLVGFLVLEPGQVTLKQILSFLGTADVAAEVSRNKGGRPKKITPTTQD